MLGKRDINIRSQVRLFSDDTVAYLTVSKMQDGQVFQSNIISSVLVENLEHRVQSKQMSVDSILPAQKLLMHRQELEPVDAAKYLGVSISKDLR